MIGQHISIKKRNFQKKYKLRDAQKILCRNKNCGSKY